LQVSVADEVKLNELPEKERYTSETDSRQVFHRLAGTWTYWGWKANFFDKKKMQKHFMMNMFICWQINFRLQIVRNGLILVFIGLMELMVQHRDIIMLIIKPVN
jgi:hypothetical protein